MGYVFILVIQLIFIGSPMTEDKVMRAIYKNLNFNAVDVTVCNGHIGRNWFRQLISSKIGKKTMISNCFMVSICECERIYCISQSTITDIRTSLYLHSSHGISSPLYTHSTLKTIETIKYHTFLIHKYMSLEVLDLDFDMPPK